MFMMSKLLCELDHGAKSSRDISPQGRAQQSTDTYSGILGAIKNVVGPGIEFRLVFGSRVTQSSTGTGQ